MSCAFHLALACATFYWCHAKKTSATHFHVGPPTLVGHWPAASLSAATVGTLHGAVALGRPKGSRPSGITEIHGGRDGKVAPSLSHAVKIHSPKLGYQEVFSKKSWRPRSNDPIPPVLAEWPASDAETQIFASQIGWPGRSAVVLIFSELSMVPFKTTNFKISTEKISARISQVHIS